MTNIIQPHKILHQTHQDSGSTVTV